jgi:hypothetical protein
VYPFVKYVHRVHQPDHGGIHREGLEAGGLAGALAAERNGVRPETPLSRLFVQRAGALAAA